MDISIIISTWNNCKRLAITLDSISKCAIPKGIEWELILVNNNCTDDTDMVVNYFAAKLPLKYIKEPRQGVSRARNKGLEAAAGTLVIFTDDDVMPGKDWISNHWSAFNEKPSGYFFGGPIESEFQDLNFDKELLKFAPPSVKGLNWGTETKVLSEKEYFIGANWACPREYLMVNGGFDVRKGPGSSHKTISVGEETDLMNRLKKLGLKPFYLPQARLKHFVPKSKATCRHIAKRWEANGYIKAEKYINNHNYHFICGVPRCMFREVFILWRKWISAKIQGNKGYYEYFSLRRMIGTIKTIYAINNRGKQFNQCNYSGL